MDQIFESPEAALAAIEAEFVAPDVEEMAAPMAPMAPAAIAADEPEMVTEPAPMAAQESAEPEMPGMQGADIPTSDLMAILGASRPKENPNVTNLSPADPQTNTLPAAIPPGMTAIPPEMQQLAVSVAAQSFPSMNQVGMILDIQDRMAYAMSVMNNQQLRSDVKAQIADQAMRDGKILLEALPSEWFEARNIVLPKGLGNGA